MIGPEPGDASTVAGLWRWAEWEWSAGRAVTPLAALADYVDRIGRELHGLGMAGADTSDLERQYDVGLDALHVTH
jgi:hypothetical protein